MSTKKEIFSKKGFTIVETLIVLSVTGLLFVTSSFLIRGQIERSRYQDGMRQLQQSFQAAIKDTENGYFPGATGTSNTNSYAGKRISFCGETDGCTDRTKLRVENLVLDKATGSLNPESAETFVLPAGLSFIGYYDELGNKSTNTYGVVMKFNVVSSRNSTISINNSLYSKIINSIKSSNLSYPAATGVVRFDLDRGGGAILPVGPPIPSIIDEGDGGAKPTPSGTNTSNVYEGVATDTQQSVDAIAYDGNKLPKKLAFCFDGYRKGSLSIEGNASSTVNLNLDDSNCQSGF